MVTHCRCKVTECATNKCSCFKAKLGCTDNCSCASCCNPDNDVTSITTLLKKRTLHIRKASLDERYLLEDKLFNIRGHFDDKTILLSFPFKFSISFSDLLFALSRYWKLKDRKKYRICNKVGKVYSSSDDVLNELFLKKQFSKTDGDQEILDPDGNKAVWITQNEGDIEIESSSGSEVDFSQSSLHKRKRGDNFLSEPEISPKRKLIPRKAKQIAKAKNKNIPAPPPTGRHRRKKQKNRKSVIEKDENGVDSSDGSTDTDLSDINKDEKPILLRRNPSFLRHKSRENLYPLFDDYEEFFGKNIKKSPSVLKLLAPLPQPTPPFVPSQPIVVTPVVVPKKPNLKICLSYPISIFEPQVLVFPKANAISLEN